MQYVTRLALVAGGLAAISLTGAAVAHLSAIGSERHIERVRLAHEVHEGYLSLSNNVFQLFKEHGDAFIIGDRDSGRTETDRRARIDADFRTLRALIGAEVALVGEEELDELEHLAEVERRLHAVLERYEEIRALGPRSAPLREQAALVQLLDSDIDLEIRALIDGAIEEERREVLETAAEVTASAARLRIVSLATAIVALAVISTGAVALYRAHARPLERIIAGAAAVESGDLGHRIAAGPGELGRVATVFNGMVARICERHEALAVSQAQLEREVDRRTRSLRDLVDALRLAERKRRRLLADVSHELRTPLTIIRGEAEVTARAREIGEEAARRALERIRETADHSARIVDDLLFVARSEAGELRLKMTTVDLAAMVAEVAADYASSVAGKTVTHDIAGPASRLRVVGDAGRLRQALLILVENALQYGDRAVAIGLRAAAGSVCLSVRDDGPGIPEEELPHVFERFYRGSNAGLRYDAGAGLGLPIAKAISEAHDGSIRLASREGGGVVATIALPALSGPRILPLDAAGDPLPRRLGR